MRGGREAWTKIGQQRLITRIDGAAGEALARVKRDELARLDTRTGLAQLADAFRLALRDARPTTTSGLVEQQKVFARLRA